jgi:hypothetical protein
MWSHYHPPRTRDHAYVTVDGCGSRARYDCTGPAGTGHDVTCTLADPIAASNW